VDPACGEGLLVVFHRGIPSLVRGDEETALAAPITDVDVSFFYGWPFFNDDSCHDDHGAGTEED
jgi:hypothetical protein